MNRKLRFLIPCALVILSQPVLAAKPLSMPEVLAASSPSDWRPLDPENTLYVELPAGRVVIELAPAFAPLHVVNIKTLARAGYFNGLSVIREQDNYVAQWGDPDNRHPLPPGIGKVAPEFDSALPAHMAFNRLPDGDVYAPEVGFSGSLPVARSEALHKVWLAHCYGMVGVGRDLDAESGSGAESRAWNCSPACRAAARRWAFIPRLKSRCRSSRFGWQRTFRPRNDRTSKSSAPTRRPSRR